MYIYVEMVLLVRAARIGLKRNRACHAYYSLPIYAPHSSSVLVDPGSIDRHCLVDNYWIPSPVFKVCNLRRRFVKLGGFQQHQSRERSMHQSLWNFKAMKNSV
jgi:hypothetical protein